MTRTAKIVKTRQASSSWMGNGMGYAKSSGRYEVQVDGVTVATIDTRGLTGWGESAEWELRAVAYTIDTHEHDHRGALLARQWVRGFAHCKAEALRLYGQS